MHCVICNKEIERSSFLNDVLCSRECHGEHFWLEKAPGGKTAPPEDRRVVVDHYHYTIGDVLPPGVWGFKGNGGHEFRVRFHDGREVTTCNLWSQGPIPEKYWEMLPDNAVFSNRPFRNSKDGIFSPD